MKPTVFYASALALSLTGISFADTTEPGANATASPAAGAPQQVQQQPSKMPGVGGEQQNMHREMMREMSTMMEQMNNTMQDMHRYMASDQVMNADRTRDTTRLMEKMSENLHVMAREMREGRIGAKEREKLQARMHEMAQLMEKLHQAAGPAP